MVERNRHRASILYSAGFSLVLGAMAGLTGAGIGSLTVVLGWVAIIAGLFHDKVEYEQ